MEFSKTQKAKYFFIFCIGLLCFNVFSQTNTVKHQLLWKIEGKNLKAPSYLFGTMHLKNERVFNLSDSVYLGIAHTDVFVAEINMDNVFEEMYQQYYKNDYKEGRKKIYTRKSSSTPDIKINERLSLNDFTPDESWMPDFIRSEDDLEYRGKNQREIFLDAYLYSLAKNLKRETDGLEFIREYDGIDAIADSLINESIFDRIGQDEFDAKSLLNAYEEGNINKIDAFRRAFPKKFAYTLLLRNLNMARRMDSIMQTKSMFAAMGCAHLPGDSGMIDLLRKRGYKLTPVKAVYTGIGKKYQFNTPAYSWTSYAPKEDNFEVSSPGKMFFVPNGVYGDMRMNVHMRPDLFRNILFMVLTTNLGYIAPSNQEEKVLEEMASRFMKNEDWVLDTKKMVNEDGKNKLYITLKKGTQFFKYVILLKGDDVLMGAVSGTGKSINDPYSKKFLESVKFLPSAIIEENKDVSMYTDTLGAYQALMPLKSKEYIESSYTEPIDIGTKYGEEPIEGNIFFNAYYLYQDGKHIENDSIALSEVLYNLKKGDGEIRNKKFTLFKNQYKALEAIIVRNEFAFSKLLLVIRGNRMYLFMVSGSEESIENNSANAYFNSLAFLHYQYPQEKQTFYANEFNFDYYDYLPTETSNDGRGSNFYKEMKQYSFNDKESSCAYEINRYIISPYYSLGNPRKFIDSLSSMQLDSLKDLVRDVKWEEKKSMLSKEFMVLNENNKYKRIKYIFTNYELFEITIYSVENDLRSEKVDNFLNSFEFNPAPKTIYADKAKKLLEDLMSRDPILSREAKNAIGMVKFSTTNLPLLEKALIKKYYIEEEEYYQKKISELLLEAMQKSFPKNYSILVKNIYLKYKGNSKLQNSILENLANNSDDSLCFYTYCSILKNNFPSELTLSYYDIIEGGRSNYSYELVELYCSLLNSPKSRSVFIQALGYSTNDSLGKVKTAIGKNISKIEECLSIFVLPAIKRRDTIETYYQTNIIMLINLFPNEKKEKWLKQFLKDKEVYVRFEAVTSMIENNINVEPKYIKNFFSGLSFRYKLFSTVKKANKLSLFKAGELTSENIAAGYFTYYLEYDDEGITNVTVVESRKVQYQGSMRTAYLFKYQYEGNKEYYVGICIPEVIEKPTDEQKNESYAYTDYEEFKDKSAKEHFDKLLKSIEEE